MGDGTSMNDGAGEFVNWMYEGSLQDFPYLPLTYTVVMTGRYSDFFPFFMDQLM